MKMVSWGKCPVGEMSSCGTLLSRNYRRNVRREILLLGTCQSGNYQVEALLCRRTVRIANNSYSNYANFQVKQTGRIFTVCNFKLLTAKLLFRRSNRSWLKGLVCKASSVASQQTRWYNKRMFRKGYSVPRDFSWIEN